ncbi:hypothetical protein [Parabacteroides goldsteinii]|uniref:hypothetical protein n=1 Tax=Parabacteroides goldsteinii TaxID=328812 RepID=UPI00101DDF5C|nr:hypothetical protein [Parabacteroides goldsteinii]
MNNELTTIILSRYLGEFEPATEQDATFRKSSTEIIQDLEDIVTLHVDDVSAMMISNKYRLGFIDDKPVWLMKKRLPSEKALTE